jgi:hypothetical protein
MQSLRPEALLLCAFTWVGACQQGSANPDESGGDAPFEGGPDVGQLPESGDSAHPDASLEKDGGGPDASDLDVAFEGGGGLFDEVQAIFDSRCTTCHDASKLGLPAYPALPLTAGASYSALVNQPAHEACGGILVVPGQLDQSYLSHKVADVTPCFGLRMPHPFDSGIVVPLSDAQLAAIRSWIERGAPR